MDVLAMQTGDQTCATTSAARITKPGRCKNRPVSGLLRGASDVYRHYYLCHRSTKRFGRVEDSAVEIGAAKPQQRAFSRASDASAECLALSACAVGPALLANHSRFPSVSKPNMEFLRGQFGVAASAPAFLCHPSTCSSFWICLLVQPQLQHVSQSICPAQK